MEMGVVMEVYSPGEGAGRQIIAILRIASRAGVIDRFSALISVPVGGCVMFQGRVICRDVRSVLAVRPEAICYHARNIAPLSKPGVRNV